MALRTNVKVGNITGLSDARYCAGMGVQWLGFPASLLSVKSLEEITSWIEGPSLVIEMGDTVDEQYLAVFPNALPEITTDAIPKIKPDQSVVVRMQPIEWGKTQPLLLDHKLQIEFLLFDQTIPSDRSILEQAAKEFEVYVLLDSPTNEQINEILSWNIKGLSFTSTPEAEIGMHDDHLATALETLEVEDY